MPRSPTSPIFVALATLLGGPVAIAQPEWSADFAGPAGSVRSVVRWDEDGAGPRPSALFVAGATNGLTEGQDVVRWDGHIWSALGGGISDGSVNALVLYDDGAGEALYAAGNFKTADGQPVGGIARWNGQNWAPLGAGLTSGGSFNSLAVYDDDGPGPIAPALYAGGWFALVDGLWCKYVARWDGQHWSPVGGGMSDRVNAMTVWDPDGPGPKHALLVAGGDFREAGGLPAEHAAAWNGKKWQTLGAGVNGPVRSLAVYGGGAAKLFVGGLYDKAGGQPAVDLATWDGTSWNPVPGLNYKPWSLGVAALAAVDPDGPGPAPRWLYVGGEFDAAPNAPGPNFGAWDGAQWRSVPKLWSTLRFLGAVGSDGPGSVDRLFIGGTELAVLTETGDAVVTIERGVSGEFVSSLNALDLDGDGPEGPSLVVTGRFRSAGLTPARRVALWDGAGFSAFGPGIGPFVFDGEQTDVYDAEVFDPDGPGPQLPELFVSASIRPAKDPNGSPDDVLLRWDGTKWLLAADVDEGVYDLLTFDEDGPGPMLPALFAGGGLSSVDGTAVHGIARWDGHEWSNVGGGVVYSKYPEYGFVSALTPFDPDGDGPLPAALAVGGLFDIAGDKLTNGLATWNGHEWSVIGGVEPGGTVYTLTTYDADGPGPQPASLAAGGGFSVIGGVSARNIAIFDGQGWSALGKGVGDYLSVLATYDDGTGPSLIAAGSFGEAGGQSAHSIAAWRDGQWSALGDGFGVAPYYYGSVSTLAVYDDDGPGPMAPALYAGGRFTVAGGLSSDCIARWGPPLPPACGADCDGSGTLDLFDFLCFVNRFNADDPLADCDGGGALDLFDFLCFVNLFNDGC